MIKTPFLTAFTCSKISCVYDSKLPTVSNSFLLLTPGHYFNKLYWYFQTHLQLLILFNFCYGRPYTSIQKNKKPNKYASSFKLRQGSKSFSYAKQANRCIASRHIYCYNSSDRHCQASNDRYTLSTPAAARLQNKQS